MVPGKGQGHARGGAAQAVAKVRAGEGAELSLGSSGGALAVAEESAGAQPLLHLNRRSITDFSGPNHQNNRF